MNSNRTKQERRESLMNKVLKLGMTIHYNFNKISIMIISTIVIFNAQVNKYIK